MRLSNNIYGLKTNIYIPKIVIKGVGKPWTNKKWACLGDSLTEENSRTTKHYFDYVSENTGIQIVNVGVSGTGYSRQKDTGNAFFQRVENIPTDVDVITIFGSGNDLGDSTPLGTVNDKSTETIGGCINTTLDNILNRFLAVGKAPVIGIVSPTPWVGANFDSYCKLLKDICEKRSIPFYDLYRKSNLNPNNAEFREICYSKDEGNGVHPDENGHKIIAPHFKSFLESLII